MNILITGGTGFIGSRFVEKCVEQGHHVYVITRNQNKYTDSEHVSYINFDYPTDQLPSIQAVVNLAGESLLGYWTEEKKKRILTSRIETTEKLIQMIREMDTKPASFISASAIGFYGTCEEQIFTEHTSVAGDDFLASVASEWESTARIVEDLGIRTLYTRFGLVLDKAAGSLPLMALPFKLFVGGKVGNGEQWISWIHIDDCIELLYFVLTNEEVHGPVNFTAPYPQRNIDFSKILAATIRRPGFIKAPAPILKLALGEMSELITKGQHVLPEKAESYGYTFKYAHLEDALGDIYKK